MFFSPNHTLIIRSIFYFLFLISINAGISQAQIVSDGTLNTLVEQLESMRKITGGERVGNNLFHSFEEFSIPIGVEAIFENAADIENIFTRITGSEASFIEGLLQTAGGANFFLVNPNGIVFGENARLDVGGSFIATTADSIEFADGTNFTARGDEPKVSLTISLPIGLGFLGNNGSITVNGSGEQITRPGRFGREPYLRNRTSGLAVPSGETFALVGNGINFNSGAVVTENGQVFLGSVSSGRVKLEKVNHSWTLDYANITAFEDVNFNKNSLIDPSGTNISSIEVFGKDIILTDNSILLIQNENTTGESTIRINAYDFLKISEGSNITTETTGQGNASSIFISAGSLFVQNQGGIVTGTFDLGKSGDINIAISEELQIIDAATTATPEGIISFTNSSGDAGNILISTQKLQAAQGASITSSTVGEGNSGTLEINAELIELEGTTGRNNTFTFIGSASLGKGNAGNVNLNTANLKISNGAAVSSDSSSNAAAGNININASQAIEVNGIDSNTGNQSSINSSVTIQDNAALRNILGLPEIPNGNAGNIIINTPTLNVTQEGTISVENQGTGEGGILSINADTLTLDFTGSLTAAAESGIGGNVTLNTQNLEIGAGSQITAEAGNDGDGGNITINTANLIAKKNSQVTANAFRGRGGNININAQGLFLFDSPENIFTASSELGIEGAVKINTTEEDIDKDLVPINYPFLSVEEVLAKSCLTPKGRGNKTRLNVLGKGGLSISPFSSLDEGEETTSTRAIIYSLSENWQPRKPIFEVNKIVETPDGQILGVAEVEIEEEPSCLN